MVHLIKILLFGIVNLIGFYTLPILLNVIIMWDLTPSFKTPYDQAQFKHLYMGIGMWIWGAAALTSIAYFVVRSVEIRMLLILAPIFAPLIYGIGLVIYCHFSGNL